MRIQGNKLLLEAYGKYALAAFNVFNAEQIMAVFMGASKSSLPVILQVTPAARNYLHPDMLEYCIRAAEKVYPNVYYSVHLDHGDVEHCIQAIESGHYGSVMIDVSHESFDINVQQTAEIVELAHKKGIAVEAELGVLSGQEDGLTVDQRKAKFTDPDQAQKFVELTNCDSLAVAVGTSHGAYKFSNSGSLQLDILSEINSCLPGFPLVLHGASAVHPLEIERINKAGGQMEPGARGTQKAELLEAIILGVCKINIATDMRLIWARTHREFFKNHPDKFDPVLPGKEYINCLTDFVEAKCRDLIVDQAKIKQ